MSLHAEQGHVPPRTGPSVFPSRGVSGLQRTDKGTVAAEGGVGPASTGGTAHVPSPLGPLGAAGTGWRRAGAGLTLQHHAPPPPPPRSQGRCSLCGHCLSVWLGVLWLAGRGLGGAAAATTRRPRSGSLSCLQLQAHVTFHKKHRAQSCPPPSSSDPPKALKQLRTPPGPGLGEVTDAPN